MAQADSVAPPRQVSASEIVPLGTSVMPDTRPLSDSGWDDFMNRIGCEIHSSISKARPPISPQDGRMEVSGRLVSLKEMVSGETGAVFRGEVVEHLRALKLRPASFGEAMVHAGTIIKMMRKEPRRFGMVNIIGFVGETLVLSGGGPGFPALLSGGKGSKPDLFARPKGVGLKRNEWVVAVPV